jgi:hypothetical protein
LYIKKYHQKYNNNSSIIDTKDMYSDKHFNLIINEYIIVYIAELLFTKGDYEVFNIECSNLKKYFNVPTYSKEYIVTLKNKKNDNDTIIYIIKFITIDYKKKNEYDKYVVDDEKNK